MLQWHNTLELWQQFDYYWIIDDGTIVYSKLLHDESHFTIQRKQYESYKSIRCHISNHKYATKQEGIIIDILAALSLYKLANSINIFKLP